MTDLSSLIARLEQVESGSRELDCDIQLIVFGDKPYGVKGPYRHPQPATLAEYVAQYRDLINSDDAVDDETVPRYTTSIDAALTLVPEGWRITHAYGPPWAWCLTKTAPEEDGSRRYAEGKSATPALALCIASIKARMAQS